jgi:signal transduction histidine kinase
MRINISGKILLALVLVFVLAVVVFFREAHRTGNALLASLSHARAENVADIGMRDIENHMLRGDREEIARSLRALSASQHVRDILILKCNGEVYFEADTTHRAGDDLLDGLERFPDRPDHRFMLVETGSEPYERFVMRLEKREACQPCHHGEPAVLGFLAVEVSLNDIRELAETHKDANIIMTVSVFSGLAAIVLLTLFLIVIRPINTLQKQIRSVEEQIPKLQRGELLPDIRDREATGGDEIMALATSFQNLVQRLNAAYAELVEVHDSQLERADQLATVGEMAASIAHEIKNPVTGIKAALQVMLRKIDTEDTHREILDEMIVQLDRITHAVNDLLSYARNTPPTLEAVVIAAMVEKTVSLLQPQLRTYDIELQVEDSSYVREIQADPKQVQQVLWNIMLNAVQAMTGGGTLTVNTMLERRHLVIEITDTGRGIPPEDAEKIFKPFFTTKCKGTGLGMSISRRIMQQHGGEIQLRSEPGKGTTVRLVFLHTHSERNT